MNLPPLFAAFAAISFFDEEDYWLGFDTDAITDWPSYTPPKEGEDPLDTFDEDQLDYLNDLDSEGEPVDTENLGVEHMEEEGIDIVCGGDWQPPCSMTIVLRDGVLTATNVIRNAEFSEGLGWESVGRTLRP